MHYLSMHELDRKSFRISEEESREIDMSHTINLLQQISLDLDHQTYCVLKIQRSQNKTIQHLKELLGELKRIQTKVESKIDFVESSPQNSTKFNATLKPTVSTSFTTPSNNKNSKKHTYHHVTQHSKEQPSFFKSVFRCISFQGDE